MVQVLSAKIVQKHPHHAAQWEIKLDLQKNKAKNLQILIFNAYISLPESQRNENFDLLQYGITGGGVFKAGIQNWKGFCIRINCSQMKLLNFENWTITGSLSSLQKSEFLKLIILIFHVKKIE